MSRLPALPCLARHAHVLAAGAVLALTLVAGLLPPG
jgi:hypothetical protein